jgi:hypothetical protein
VIVTGGVGISGNTFIGGNLNVQGNIESTSKTTGTVIVTGGVGISGNTFIGGNLNVQGNIESTSKTTGTVIVTGGVGISGNTFIGGNLNVQGNIESTSKSTGTVIITGGVGISGNTFIGGNLNVLGNIESTSKSTGTVIITGGVGISGNTFIGGNLNVQGNIESTSKTTGTVIVTGGVGISGNTFIGGNLNVQGNIESTSKSTGTVIVTGGVGISGNTFIGGNLNVQGNIESTSKTTGTVIVTGGVGISGNTFIGGNLNVQGNIESTSKTTGTVIVTGGVGISGNTFIGGNLNVQGNIESTSKSTGTVIVTGGVGISGNTFIGGNLNVQGNIESTSKTTGTVIVTGGVGISGNTFIGGNLNVQGNIESTSKSTGTVIITGGVGISGNTFIGGNLNVLGNIESTSKSTGTVIITGGVGISGNTFIGGNLNVTRGLDSTSMGTGTVIITGGTSISGNTFMGGNTFIGGNISIGKLTNSGYTVDVSGTTNLSGYLTLLSDASFGGNLFINGTTPALNPTTGALIVAGGVGIGGNLWVYGNTNIYGLNIYSTTNNSALVMNSSPSVLYLTNYFNTLASQNIVLNTSSTTRAFTGAASNGMVYSSCAISADGKYQLVSSIGYNGFGTNDTFYLSTNNGQSFTYGKTGSLNGYGIDGGALTTGGKPYRAVAMSTTGQYQMAFAITSTTNSVISISNNYGTDSWKTYKTDSVTPPNMPTLGTINSLFVTGIYTSAAISNDGNVISFSVYGGNIWSTYYGTGIYSSLNAAANNNTTFTTGGANWNSNNIVQNWSSNAMSITGQYQVACVGGSTNTGNIWVSNQPNYLSAVPLWQELNQGTAGNPYTKQNWYSIAISNSGQYVSAVAKGGNIWTSNLYGTSGSWTNIAPYTGGGTSGTQYINQNWSSIAISTTGQYQVAAINPGNLWMSNNYGSVGSWSMNQTLGMTSAANKTWNSVAISSFTTNANGANIFTNNVIGVTGNGTSTGAGNIYTIPMNVSPPPVSIISANVSIGKIQNNYPLDILGTTNITGNLIVTNDVSFNSNLVVGSRQDSTSVGTGALIIAGGTSIGGNTFIGGNLNVTKGLDSTSVGTGTVIISGGTSISGNTFIGGNLNVQGNIESTSTTTGTVIVTGGVGISGNTFIGGNLNVTKGLDSTSVGTGTVIISGGASISGNTFMGGNLNVTKGTESTSTTSGTLIVTGGMGLTGNAFIGGNVTINSTSDSSLNSLPAPAALNVLGGVNITKSVNIKGKLYTNTIQPIGTTALNIGQYDSTTSQQVTSVNIANNSTTPAANPCTITIGGTKDKVIIGGSITINGSQTNVGAIVESTPYFLINNGITDISNTHTDASGNSVSGNGDSKGAGIYIADNQDLSSNTPPDNAVAKAWAYIKISQDTKSFIIKPTGYDSSTLTYSGNNRIRVGDGLSTANGINNSLVILQPSSYAASLTGGNAANSNEFDYRIISSQMDLSSILQRDITNSNNSKQQINTDLIIGNTTLQQSMAIGTSVNVNKNSLNMIGNIYQNNATSTNGFIIQF